jgi:ubiquinone/menaquinone biosynthesis C-methylase UbiE
MAFGYILLRQEWFLRAWVKRLLGWTQIARRLQAPVVMQYLNAQAGDVVLDLGSASGHYTVEIAKKARFTIAIEYDVRDLEVISTAVAFGHQLSACRADVGYLPLASKVADKILISGTLQSVDANKILLECRRILKPGGSLVIVVLADHPLIRNIYNPTWGIKARFLVRWLGLPPTYQEFKNEYCQRRFMTRLYTIEELKQLLGSFGFRLEDSQYRPSGLASFLMDFHHVLTWRPKTSWIGNWLFFLFAYPIFWLAQPKLEQRQSGSELISRFVYQPIPTEKNKPPLPARGRD